MKTIAVVTAALAISLAFAGTASADSITITRTDAFGNNQSVTQSIDNFGNRSRVIRRDSDNGIVHCRTVTLGGTDAWGGSASRTIRRCAPDF